ncbi:MAG: hypothetical protein A3A57_02710 [Candidatus Woykebacteria bacterium RIFCSPLOWO2_01_FULL_41_12]|uniref:Glycosyltransferase subfamily 4-like N-terminal domain-containing protein n=1 Tax=Candidatus Woykebacteria bacterium RIFCSPLOWO2_01_FULL_41_12 TaxID=1802604 RepID=A0A1G1WZV4_9BACT|nr:MAG: hypothetical protein A3A57_02710 [Candidatus Woykebacteria bacterium RIFCSPLOWO2_01_FULL_41_12]
MKIAFFTETYYPELNGVSVSLDFVKKQLERKGHEVFIFAPKVRGYQSFDDHVIRLSTVRVINSEPKQRLVLPIPNSTFRKMMSLKFDVIHAHGGGFSSLVGYQLALLKGYPFVLTYHTYIEKYTHYFFVKNSLVTGAIARQGSKFMCNLSDIVVVPTKKMKKVLEKYGVKKEIQVVPNPIDLTMFKKGRGGFLHQKLKLPKESIILLTASRLGKEKNLDFLIKSFALVARELPFARLVLVGDGPERERLETLAAELGLEKTVILTGYIDTKQMPLVYSDADIFLFASTSETQGMVIPEAAACGLPIVAVRDEAFSDLVVDDYNGYLVSENRKKFAAKLTFLIKNQQKRDQFGKNSVRLVNKIFDVDYAVKNLEAVYQKAIATRRQTPRLSSRFQVGVRKSVGLLRYLKELNQMLSRR